MSWTIDCEINLILTWFENFVISSETGETKLSMTLCSSCNFINSR